MAEGERGIINEIGDLGLGFYEIPKEEQKILKEQEQKEKQEDSKK